MKRLTPHLGALLVVILLAVVGYLAASLEQVEEEVNLPPSSLAKVHPLLALERLLEVNQVDTMALNSSLEPPSVDALWVVVAAGRDQGPDKVLDWVSRGGHLVLTPARGERDSWFEALDISVEDGPSGADASETTVVSAEPASPESTDSGPTDSATEDPKSEDSDETDEAETLLAVTPLLVRTWTLGEGGETGLSAVIEMPEDTLVLGGTWFDATVATTEAGDIVAATHPSGAGRVTVLLDGTLLSNDHLGVADNAPWFWDWVQAGTVSSAQLVLRGTAPGAFALAWRHGKPAVLALGWVLLIWFAMRVSRFGPVLADPTRARRSVLEHASAVGRFLWRNGQGGPLIAEARNSLLRRVSARVPAARGLTPVQAVPVIAKACGIDEQTVHLALIEEPGRSQLLLVRILQAMERLR